MIWNYIIYIILTSFIVIMSYYFIVDFKIICQASISRVGMELKVILNTFAVTRIYLECTVLILTLYLRAVLSLNFKRGGHYGLLVQRCVY